MSTAQRLDENYMRLIRKFPLMPIRTKAELARAVDMVDRLSDRLDQLSVSERAYFDVLCNVIKAYESQRYKPRYIDPREALKYLMEENGLTLTDLVPVVKHKSHLSAFLNGHRGLSKTNAVRLAAHFKISPEIFLPVYSRESDFKTTNNF